MIIKQITKLYSNLNEYSRLNTEIDLKINKRCFSTTKIYHKNHKITSEVINNLLVNQGVSISQEDLDKLKSIPGVKFDLPLNDETFTAFINLVGRQRSQKKGIYIFTHLASGSKYVGSSGNLSYRIFRYFRHVFNNNINSGLILPMLREQGLKAFSLEIFIMPKELSSGKYYLFLEQYHLLNKLKFDLNTQRIVQFKTNQDSKIYIYDLEEKFLYYSCDTFSKLRTDLGIHFSTFKKYLNQENGYLNFFKFKDTLIEDAQESKLSLLELNNLIAEKHTEKNKSMTFSGKRFINSKSIIIKEVETGNIQEFSSILAVVSYLESINIKANRNSITKYLNTGKPYKNYIFYDK